MPESRQKPISRPPEFRQNPITKEWVIIATGRAKRPDQFLPKEKAKALPAYVPTCPFCPGNERLTPPETFRIPTDGTWLVRSVPNKFSALDMDGDYKRAVEGLKRAATAIGKHEVLVETPDHSLTTALLPTAQVQRILEAYKQRYLDLVQQDSRIQLVTIFKNHGASAGTSLEHPHSQLIATPIISPQVRFRMEEAMRYFDECGECIFCRLLEDELKEGTRIIAANEHFVTYVPYAELSPFAFMIFPRRHMAAFAEINEAELGTLAHTLRDGMRRIYYGLGNPDFNYSIRTAPCENRYVRYYHWYISVIPRLTKVAGFELGSGFFINVTLPEQNAEFLRNVQVPQSEAAPAQA